MTVQELKVFLENLPDTMEVLMSASTGEIDDVGVSISYVHPDTIHQEVDQTYPGARPVVMVY